MNPKIFISYRRADSQDFTDHLFNYMAKYFGAENVFQDVGEDDKIPPGVKFEAYLIEQVRRCDVVLAVIGDQWVRLIQERLASGKDYVRMELEIALGDNKIVIPVLKSAAQMPQDNDLPASIRELATFQYRRVRQNPDFERDCSKLIKDIHSRVGMNHPITLQTIVPTITVFRTNGVSSADLLPVPFDWIELPQQDFCIAKYPVTNAQFAIFKKDNGYHLEDWWLKSGWKERVARNWIAPRYWYDPKWNAAKLPVVGVSWYEAVAFTRWLSHKTGENIQLPTETQWQYAAQGEDNRPFPWGTSWNSDRCNCSTGTAISQGTTPVTKYENIGNSPFGVVDMIGNVWEWCLDWDQIKQPLRGGCWRSKSVAIEKRTERRPELSFNLWGFRLVKQHN